MITGIKENPPQSWKCCIDYSGLKEYIYTFLEELFRNSDKQKKYVKKNTIITEKDTPDKLCKYQILYKTDKNSSRIIPILIHPKPCNNNPCMYVKKY